MILDLVAVLAAALAAAVPAPAADRDGGRGELAKLLENRVAGKPIDCINLRDVTSTQVVDRTAIVYRIGGTLYVNEPRAGADSLRHDDVLVTHTIGSDLCSIDTVRLVSQADRFERGFVGLGPFVPYARPQPAK